MSWGSPLCKVFFCDGTTSFGEACPVRSFNYFSITLFFILSFSYLPVRTIGYNLKSSGMAHEAELLVTVGRGGVRSVRIFRAKLHKVIKGTECPFVRGKMYLSYDSKKRGDIAPPWSPRATRAKSVWVRALYRSKH